MKSVFKKISKKSLYIISVSGVVLIGLFGLVFWAGFRIGVHDIADKDLITVLKNKDSEGTALDFAATPSPAVTTDFGPFWKTWRILDENFVPVSSASIDQIDTDAKVVKSIQGLVSSYNDPYTTFFNSSESKSFKDMVSGSFFGIGTVLNILNGLPVVTQVLPGTPAEQAHIHAADTILAVDGRSTTGMALEQVIKMIRGQDATPVTLSILSPGSTTPISIAVTRGSVAVPSTHEAPLVKVQQAIDRVVDHMQATGQTIVVPPPVIATISSQPAAVLSAVTVALSSITQPVSDMLTGKKTPPSPTPQVSAQQFFVFGLSIFSGTSQQAFQSEMQRFKDSGTKNLIIDLRDNGGGYLDAAVDMASYFLPKDAVVVTERHGKGSTQQVITHVSKGYTLFSDPTDIHIIMLVNQNTASAAEILAAALSEYGRATLVGSKTYGKGSVQQLVDITDTMSLKITVARWYTPHGISLSGNGLVPAYVVIPDVDNTHGGTVDPVFEKAIEVLLQKK
jgi:C-terminal processing protease CtpA/Prc